MKTFIIVTLLIMGLNNVIRLYYCHLLIQGDDLPERTVPDYIVTVLLSCGMIIWGLWALQ